MHSNNAANTKAQVQYDGTAGEGVDQATFSSCGETMAKDEADDLRTMNATSREDECFRTRVVFETSSDEVASMSKACLIKGDKKCETDMIEEIATKKDIKSEVAMDESMADGHFETFPTPVLVTSAVAPVCHREYARQGKGNSQYGRQKLRTKYDKGR